MKQKQQGRKLQPQPNSRQDLNLQQKTNTINDTKC